VPPRTLPLVLACLALTSVAGGTARVQPTSPQEAGQPRAAIDIQALDTAGRPVLNLTAADLMVTVDGQPRPIRSLRYVFQGAGAEEAARSGLTTSTAVAAPARAVVIAIDENTIRRGRERTAASAAWRVVDSLTPTDLIGVIALPRPRGQTPLLADRGPLRPALNSISGRARTDSGLGPIAGPPPPPPDPADIRGPDDIDRPQRPDAPPVPVVPAPAAPGPAGAQAGTADAADDSFRTLRVALDSMRPAPGRKFLVYLTGGDASPGDLDLAGAAGRLRELVDAAALARVSLHVIRVADRGTTRVEGALQQLAAETGGTVSVVTSKRADLAAFTASLSGGYLLEVEPAASDRADRPVTLSAQTSRSGVKITAASRWCAREDPVPEPPAAPAAGPSPSPETTSATSARAPAGARLPARDPELDVVLARVARYVDTYLAELGSVVAEENYHQILRRGTTVLQTRRTKADLLLLRADKDWIPFRDVFEVDGKPVRDREDRLRKLFLENPGQALAEGRRITEEGSRYNVGLVQRTINTPNVALSFFQSALLPAFRFERRGTDTVDGERVWRIDYTETGRPTQVKRGTTGEDLPSAGSIWVEPASGRIVRTLLKNGDAGTAVEVSVRYQPNDAIGLWTPVRMEERYWSASGRRDTISSDATYSSFRRFQVDTAEAVAPPK
jgi:hypothetical protein